MMNSEWTELCARELRDRVIEKTHDASREARIQSLFRSVLGRNPDQLELETMNAFFTDSQHSMDENLLAACHAMLNTSEFLYVE